MTNKPFVLVLADPDKAKAVREGLRAVPGVSDVQQLAGPYDIVAFIDITHAKADTPSLISKRIRALDGVASTTTCVPIPEAS